jgi:YVTN family beta-propeller protein
MRRRLLLIAVPTALALALFAPQALARFAYTGNYDGDSVSVIDTEANQVVGLPIAVGNGPYSTAVTPNGKTLYVANEVSEDLTALDTQARQVVGTPIALGTKPAVIAISPDGKTAYVTSQEADVVVVVDTQTNQVLGAPIVVGKDPWGVAFSPDGKFAYVTGKTDGIASVIDTQSRQVVATITVGNDPINVVLSPDGRTAFVDNIDDDTVSTIDTQTRQVVGSPIAVGDEPWGLAVSPDGTRLYVSNYGDDTVSVVNTQTRQVVGSPIPVGDEPYELALTPDGKTLYVANYGEQSVSAVNTQTSQVTEIPVAGGPRQLAIVPDQSPIASFSFVAGKAASVTYFNGLASSDPDGSIARFDWSFGDGTTAANGGPFPTRIYAKAGVYSAGLAVTDDEGCSANLVFTGRTAYCSGSASATQVITVIAPNNFTFGKLTRNLRKGTAKLRVKVPAAGKLQLRGNKARAIMHSAKKAGTVILTIRPKRKLNKALKKSHQARVHIRVTFSPTGGAPRTRSKTLKLIRR